MYLLAVIAAAADLLVVASATAELYFAAAVVVIAQKDKLASAIFEGDKRFGNVVVTYWHSSSLSFDVGVVLAV